MWWVDVVVGVVKVWCVVEVWCGSSVSRRKGRERGRGCDLNGYGQLGSGQRCGEGEGSSGASREVYPHSYWVCSVVLGVKPLFEMSTETWCDEL